MDWDPTQYRYVQIADDLEHKINSGELPPRAALPSIDRLAEEYEVARMTIVRAVRVLTDRGRVVVLSGRGTFVRPPAVDEQDDDA